MTRTPSSTDDPQPGHGRFRDKADPQNGPITTLESIERRRKEKGIRDLTNGEIAMIILSRQYNEKDYIGEPKI